jgi:hypothetical protein
MKKGDKNVLNVNSTLTASNLKEALWITLNQVKSKKVLPGQADAVASQAREILRTVKVQLQISGQTNRAVPVEVIEFSEGKTKRPIKK